MQEIFEKARNKPNARKKRIVGARLKRVDRCNNPTRPILLQLHNFENKLNFLTCNLYNLHPNAISTHYNVKLDTLNYEKTRNIFCKFSMELTGISAIIL